MLWYHLHARTLSMFSRGPDEIGCGHAIRDGTLEFLHLAGKRIPRYGTNTSVACGVSFCMSAHLCICVSVVCGCVCVLTHSGVSDRLFPKAIRNTPSCRRRCRLHGIRLELDLELFHPRSSENRHCRFQVRLLSLLHSRARGRGRYRSIRRDQSRSHPRSFGS